MFMEALASVENKSIKFKEAKAAETRGSKFMI
jgi:hypothetical protein